MYKIITHFPPTLPIIKVPPLRLEMSGGTGKVYRGQQAGMFSVLAEFTRGQVPLDTAVLPSERAAYRQLCELYQQHYHQYADNVVIFTTPAGYLYAYVWAEDTSYRYHCGWSLPQHLHDLQTLLEQHPLTQQARLVDALR